MKILDSGERIRDPGQRRLYHAVFDLIDKMRLPDRMRVLRAISIRFRAEQANAALRNRGSLEVIFGHVGEEEE